MLIRQPSLPQPSVIHVQQHLPLVRSEVIRLVPSVYVNLSDQYGQSNNHGDRDDREIVA